jgi:predicted  nucleic acid-binding Zn-ribbon protein
MGLRNRAVAKQISPFPNSTRRILVKASTQEQNTLLQLQAIDTRIQQLEYQIKNLPQRAALAELSPLVDNARHRLVAKSGELDDARTELGRVESDVSIVEARRKRDSDRLQGTASMKDVQGLETELTALAKRQGDLEDIELVVMERIEGLEAELASLTADRDQLGARVAELEAEQGAEGGKLEAERAAAAADRAAISSQVSSELLTLYERQRGRYGIGAAKLVNGVSLGSNVKLTESDLATIRIAADDEVVICPDSGAILIRDENSGL